MTDDIAALGAQVRACRQLAGLSQEQLAERSGLSIRAIRNLERGHTRWPHPDSVHRLADALDLRGAARADFVAAAGRRLAPAAVSVSTAPADGPHQAGSGQIVPRQLPGQVRQFTGRENELTALTSLLGQTGASPPGAVVISVIMGTAGVGKTALAVQWAHRVAGEFPDGQLYVNLRGYDASQPVSASDALAGFLRALGMAGQEIPADADERAAAYRSALAGRRMLVVLDNARHVEQVRPLLPGSPTCVTVVTSRDTLAGLIARDGAFHLELDLLPLPDAVGLLRGLIGSRVDDDPDAAATLAGQSCRLPLALRIAAELAVASPGAPLAVLAAELADLQRRLDVLETGGDQHTAMRTVFSWSYRHLDSDVSRAFRMASLHPGPDLDGYAAAALTGSALQPTSQQLQQLARAHLIQSTGPGRYAMHDLLRGYAHELAEAHDSEQEQRAALTTLFDHYLHTAAIAMDAAFPAERSRRPAVPPAPATAVPVLADEAAALAWLAADLACLVTVTVYTADHGWPGHATRLSATLFRYLDTAGHFPEAITIHSHAARAARRVGDRGAEADSLIGVGLVDGHQGRHQQATGHFEQALAGYQEAGDQVGQARALNYLGLVHLQHGWYEQAADRLQQALILFRMAGERTGEAYAVSNLGVIAARQGRYRQAADHQQQALALLQAMGNRHGEASIQVRLGIIALRQGRYPLAASQLQQALTRYSEIGDRQGAASALARLGLVALRQGRYQQAASQLQQALTEYRDMDDPSGQAQTLNSLGEMLLETGRPADARTEHAAAHGLAAQAGERYEQARAHAGLASACQASGNARKAHHHWREALALYTDLDAPEADQVRAQLAIDNHDHDHDHDMPAATLAHRSLGG
ncbi:MAG: ATP-binding protein [Streptosporangiaceae bacterium]